MPVRGVIGDKVEDDADVAPMKQLEQAVEVLDSTEQRVHSAEMFLPVPANP
jgi:hypothetical protein